MKKLINLIFIALLVYSCSSEKIYEPGVTNSLRAPAYPLVTMDPYISTWSLTDKLYDDVPRHWTKAARPLTGAIRVDGQVYRFMGVEEIPTIPVIYTGEIENWDAMYTEQQPKEGWEKPTFRDTTGWKAGKAPFSTRALAPATRWRSKDLWVKREIEIAPDLNTQGLMLKYSYDDFAEIFINGIQVVSTDNLGKINQVAPLTEEVLASLKPGKNIIAAHAHNEAGLHLLDFGLVRKTDYRILFPQTAEQKSVNLLPTQTWYTFDCGKVSLEVIFTAPVLLNDLRLLSRPINYITYQVKSNDDASHAVQVYFETTPQWAVNTINQPIESEMLRENGINYLKAGTIEQPVLGKKGDDVRIDWGYHYMAAKEDTSFTLAIGDPSQLKKEFISGGKLSNTVDENRQSKMYLQMTGLSISQDLGNIGPQAKAGNIMIGYDDVYSIQYFGENLMGYWKENGAVDIKQAFTTASNDYNSIMKRCIAFNKKMFADAEKAGGLKYAELCALAYRQSVVAHKLVATKDGELLWLSKENTSNGCINTVDVTYPSAPLYLVYNPELMKGMLNGIFYFSESGKYTQPFAAHDIGTYPLANGVVYREPMPIEEAGNMIILTAAICKTDGNAAYAQKHWETLSTWANYLLEKGLDPENQLCTDDFAGHLAHNANLSVKAIMGVAGYGMMADMLGKKDVAEKYTTKAREMAKEWVKLGLEGDHYKLAFDQANTWSQKYNLVWDKLLKLNIFPADIAKTEMTYYLTKQNTYGLPLDSRRTYTKNDWVMWTSVLADDKATFDALVDPMWKYANETATRMPVSDWHETTDGKSVGMIARSVVGGYFMKMLEQKLD
jgi:hypothetical protein